MDKLNPCKDKKFYREWSLAHTFCQVCGIGEADARRERWPCLQSHHIAKLKRSHEATNLLRVCVRCHALCEGIQKEVDGGELIGRLTIPQQMAIKKAREPEDYDEARLLRLLGWKGFVPAEIPEWALSEWKRRRG